MHIYCRTIGTFSRMRILQILTFVVIGLTLIAENEAFSKKYLRKLMRQARMKSNLSKKMMMAASQSDEMSAEENMLGSEFEWDEKPLLKNWKKYFRWLIKQRWTTTLPPSTSTETPTTMSTPTPSTKPTSDKVPSTVMPVTKDPSIVVSTESSTPKTGPSTLLPLPGSSQNPSITTNVQTTLGPYPTVTATSKPSSTTKDTRIDVAGNPVVNEGENEGVKKKDDSSPSPSPSAYTTEAIPTVPILTNGESSTPKQTTGTPPNDKVLGSLSNSETEIEINTKDSLVYPGGPLLVDFIEKTLGNGHPSTVNMENGGKTDEDNGGHSDKEAKVQTTVQTTSKPNMDTNGGNVDNEAVESSLKPQTKSDQGPKTTVFFTTPQSPKVTSYTFQVVSTGAPVVSKSVDNGEGFVIVPAVDKTKSMSSSSSSSLSSSSSSTQVINNQAGWVIIPPIGETYMEVMPNPVSKPQNENNNDKTNLNTV